MEIEKVKEIKKALELNEYYAIEYFPKSGEPKIFTFTDLIALINELESENERLIKCREADYKTMTALRQANTELNECMDEMQDRIAELENENVKQLKQFAEKLKEKLFSVFGKTICSELDTEDITIFIDELLKE